MVKKAALNFALYAPNWSARALRGIQLILGLLFPPSRATGRPRRLRYVGGVAALASLIVVFPCSAAGPAPDEIASAATKAIGTLSPLSIALGPLISQAIDKGNEALQQRLDQLNGIIQSALFNLNQILKENLQDADEKVRRQRMEAIREADRLAQQIKNVINVSIDQLDESLKNNIASFNDGLGNIVAALPIPTVPLVNVRPPGLTMLRVDGDVSRITVTGSGLFKYSKTPSASLVGLSSQDVDLRVEAASMGLLLLAVPSAVIPHSTTPVRATLKLRLRSGWLPWSVSEPTVPVVVCGALPRYVLDATLARTGGRHWEHRIVSGGKIQLNCTGGSVDERKIERVVSPGWILDSDALHSGLDVEGPSGDGSHAETWEPGPQGAFDHFSLRCRRQDSGAGSHASVENVKYAEKRQLEDPKCGSVSVTGKPLSYSGLTQLELSPGSALGDCDEQLATPNTLIAIEIRDSMGVSIEKLNMMLPSSDQKALDGNLVLSVDGTGLLSAKLKPGCTVRDNLSTAMESRLDGFALAVAR
jgi:hypothetical protein